jgi:hypothetical protein
MHPHLFNDLWDVQTTSLPSIADLIAPSNRIFAMCGDIAAYFQTFRLCPESKFIFHGIDGKLYRLNVIPTGARQCPSFAQIYSEAIAYGVSTEFPELEITIYLDNFRIRGTNRTRVLEAWKKLTELAREAGVLFESEHLEPITKYTFLGIDFGANGDDVTVCPSQKTKQKLSRWCAAALDTASLRNFLQLFGLLQYVTTITQWEKHQFYYVYKFLRRRVGTHFDAPANIWPSIRPLLTTWIRMAINCEPRTPTRSADTPHRLYSDASLDGWGAILFLRDGTIRSTAGTFSELQSHLHINAKEAIAIREGWALLGNDLQPHEVELHTDNTTVMYCLRASRSRSYVLSQILTEIPFKSAQYISSALNPADFLSRCNTTFTYYDNDPVNTR